MNSVPKIKVKTKKRQEEKRKKRNGHATQFPIYAAKVAVGKKPTWSDAVAIKRRLGRHRHSFPNGLLLEPLGIQRSAEPPGALLVHLCAGRNAIDGHEKQLPRFYLPVQMLDVVEDLNEHLVLRHPVRCAVVVFVRAVVDDSVHIEL